MLQEEIEELQKKLMQKEAEAAKTVRVGPKPSRPIVQAAVLVGFLVVALLFLIFVSIRQL
jgi:hypothetical protein